MSQITLASNASGTAIFTVASPATSTNRTLTLPDVTGTVLAGGTPSSSITNTVTNKIAIVIGGTTYYLLASTSGT
jgi:hypothetical protein